MGVMSGSAAVDQSGALEGGNPLSVEIAEDLAGNEDPWGASGEELQPLTHYFAAEQVGDNADEDFYSEDDNDDDSDNQLGVASSTVGDQIFKRLSENLHSPYAPAMANLGASSRTVLQECYFKGRLKQLKKISDEATDLDL